MTDFEGSSDTQTINLGFDGLNSINGRILKNNNNNYYINLTWNNPSEVPDDSTVKYFINYLGETFSTSNTSYQLPVYYGSSTIDEATGQKIVEEVCLTIETRYYFEDGSYSQGATQTFCFCPPSDPYCKKVISSKSNNSSSNSNNSSSNTNISVTNSNNISTKMKYASAVTNINGASGFNFNNCSSINFWRSQAFRMALAKNDCYKKSDVIILPNQDTN
tara:strand:- start:7500 stop:8156 length:657 start_codon:yes stop_codon:yes gene_type:complete